MHVPGNIDIAELLVRMQFAIYSSPSDFDMTPKSDIANLNKASDGCVEDEEEPEVIIENEDFDVTIEDDDDEDASGDEGKIEKTVEGEELTIIVSEDHNEKDAENNERNVNDVSSEETLERMKWNDLIDQEEKQRKVIFVIFLHLQLLVSFKFQDVQYCDKLHVHHSYRLNCRKCDGTLFAILYFSTSFCIIIPHLAAVLEMNVKWYLHAAEKLKTGISCRVVREDTVVIYCIDAKMVLTRSRKA